MAIDYKTLFADNFFTRAQVDKLIRLAELLRGEGTGGSDVPDNSKADKITLIATDIGLLGGGDLSGNRTLAIDFAYLDTQYPRLVNGKVPGEFLPPQSTHDTFVVASEAAMLALSTADKGDYAVRSDNAKTFVLGGDGNPATLANWTELPAATGASSFNGRTGAVIPASGDYTFAQIGSKPTTLAGYGITDSVEPAIAPGSAGQYWKHDKTWADLNKTAVGLPNVDNTADSVKPLGSAAAATLAAGTGGAGIGHIPPGTGAIASTVTQELNERAISLRRFATGDGVTDDTTAIQNWLNALVAQGRKGYVPKGDYVVGTAVSVSGDNIEVECHPLANFIGLSNESLGSNLAPAANDGTWTLSTNVTQDGSGLHFNGANNLGTANHAVTFEDNATYEITWTIAGYVGGSVRLLLYGPTNNHLGSGVTRSANGTYTERVTLSGTTTAFTNSLRIQATGTSGTNDYDITSITVKKVTQSANTPMMTMTSATGSNTARVGTVRWTGGVFKCDQRNYTSELNGIGLKVENYASIRVENVNFTGVNNHEVNELAGKAGTGLYVSCCDRVQARNNLFIGFVEAGLLLTGGALSSNTDDGTGALVQGNHFVTCKYGWKAMRTMRAIAVSGNAYDSCYIAGAAIENGSARAARVSVNGEIVRRPGFRGFQLREQVGFIVSNNTILDCGYKVDGTTTIAAAIGILLEGCTGGEVANNVVRMDELAKFTGTYGIKNALYVDGATTIQPTDVNICNNHIGGVQFGASEAGATGVNNRYRNNDYSNVDTNYDNVPAAFAPYGDYTPTTAALTNIATATPQVSHWRRVDRDIIVSFFVTLDPTAAGAGTFTLTLPVDPGVDFGDAQDVLGNLSSGTAGGSAHGHVLATVGARTAAVNVNFGTDVAAHGWAGTFSYRIGAAVTTAPPPAGTVLQDNTGQDILDAVGGQQITVDL